MYRYLYTNGVRFENSIATPALYDAIAGTPAASPVTSCPTTSSRSTTLRDRAARPELARPAGLQPRLRLLEGARPDRGTKGKKTPLFLTQGFLENNTKPDGTWDLFNGMAGPKRAWFGMWITCAATTSTAPAGWRWGARAGSTRRCASSTVTSPASRRPEAPTEKDPPLAVESSDGKWPSEAAWPPPDSFKLATPLKPGSYTDDTTNNGSGEGGSPNGEGIWTFSTAARLGRPFRGRAAHRGSTRRHRCRTRT